MIVERSWTEPDTNPLVVVVANPFELKAPLDTPEMTHEEAMALLLGRKSKKTETK